MSLSSLSYHTDISMEIGICVPHEEYFAGFWTNQKSTCCRRYFIYMHSTDILNGVEGKHVWLVSGRLALLEFTLSCPRFLDVSIQWKARMRSHDYFHEHGSQFGSRSSYRYPVTDLHSLFRHSRPVPGWYLQYAAAASCRVHAPLRSFSMVWGLQRLQPTIRIHWGVWHFRTYVLCLKLTN